MSYNTRKVYIRILRKTRPLMKSAFSRAIRVITIIITLSEFSRMRLAHRDRFSTQVPGIFSVRLDYTVHCLMNSLGDFH